MAKATGELRPEPPFVGLGEAVPVVGDGLAGKSSTDEVRSFDVGPVDGGDVSEVGHAGPVSGEDAPGVGVGFGLPDDAHAGPLKPKVEAADAGKEGTDIQKPFTPRLTFTLGLPILGT